MSSENRRNLKILVGLVPVILIMGFLDRNFKDTGTLRIDEQCNPTGFFGTLTAWWNPKAFWSEQIPLIKREAEFELKSYQINVIEERKEKALAALEDQKSQIEQAADREETKVIAPQMEPQHADA